MINIDGDFKTEMGNCEFHCSPTCHPCQVDPEKWHYGCTHKAWPQNKHGDFVPFVECDGDTSKCELKQHRKLIGRYVGGKKRSLNYLKSKMAKIECDLKFIELINK